MNFIEIEPYEWITDRDLREKIGDPFVFDLMFSLADSVGWNEQGGSLYQNEDSISRTIWLADDPRVMEIVKNTDYNSKEKLEKLFKKAQDQFDRLTFNQKNILESFANEAEIRYYG